jgi:hypothetical protein
MERHARTPRSIRLLLACVVAAGVVFGQSGAKLTDARKKAANEFATKFWRSRPKTAFEAWDPATRAQLLTEADAFGPVPEGAYAELAAILWKPASRFGPRFSESGGSKLETPYGEAKLLRRGDSGKGKGLVIGLHGGGEGAGDAGEAAGTWRLPNTIGMYPQGIRLVHDTWNTVHGERFILSLIEIAKAQYQIDPDRVYVMGFSMGGTGSWFMAGRHPDLFAGAAPCAGVLMADPKSQVATKEEVRAVAHGLLPNVRNLAMWSFIGLSDRNCMPGTFLFVADRMEELKRDDPEGYRLWNFKTYPGLAHAYPPGEPSACFKFLEKERRDAFPKKLVWEYATDPFPLPDAEDKTTRYRKTHFYWLRNDAPADRQTVIASREGNAFSIESSHGLGGIRILLNPKMIDVAADVVVTSNGKEVYRGNPAPSLRAMAESLDAKVDTTLLFDREIEL